MIFVSLQAVVETDIAFIYINRNQTLLMPTILHPALVRHTRSTMVRTMFLTGRLVVLNIPETPIVNG